MKRECTHITKGDRGWHHIVTLGEEYRDIDFAEAEKLLTTRDGRTLYDVRIHPETLKVWIKKKDMTVNIVTSRNEKDIVNSPSGTDE